MEPIRLDIESKVVKEVETFVASQKEVQRLHDEIIIEQKCQKDVLQSMELRLNDSKALQTKIEHTYKFVQEVKKALDQFKQSQGIADKTPNPLIETNAIDDVPTLMQFNVLSTECKNLAADISALKRLNYERDFTDEILAKSPHSSVNPNFVAKKEFLGMKQLIGKQQLAIQKLDNKLSDGKAVQSQIDKLETTNSENYELFKKLIDEVDDCNRQSYIKLTGKVNGKPDFGVFDTFRKNVEDNIISKMNQKIDVMDHK